MCHYRSLSSFLILSLLQLCTSFAPLYIGKQRPCPPTTTFSFQLATSSLSSTFASHNNNDSSSHQIIYQKVIRLKTASSLPQIINYVQNEFTLPDLHMPFQSFITNNNDDTDVLYWDSSLSPSPEVSRLFAQVVVIFPEEGKDKATNLIPTMAMIVVKRKKRTKESSSSSIPLMIFNLLTDSHEKIVKALDRGLNDFEINVNTQPALNRKNNGATRPTVNQPSIDTFDTQEDYAIAAARKVISQHNHQPATTNSMNTLKTASSSAVIGPFCDVEVNKTSTLDSSSTKSIASFENKSSMPFKGESKRSRSKTTTVYEPNVSEPLKPPPKNLRVTISKPKATKKSTKISQTKLVGKEEESTVPQIPLQTSTNKRNITIQVDDTSLDMSNKPLTVLDLATSHHPSPTLNTTVQTENDIWTQALDMMPTMSNEEAMTPQEIFQQVIQFDTETRKQDMDGQGFAQGVFQKTKELLVQETARNGDMSSSVEQELKDLFAAGERLVQGKMVQSLSPSSSSSSSSTLVTEEYVDELIDMDTTVTRNIKSLEDELAELEVRVSRSVGERSYDIGPNPMFDVFSGPGEYNPNVDPETAVNWPGAPMGTRTDVRLPPELAAAVKQAQFAASTLTQVREEEDGAYFLGSRSLSQTQVDQLRRIVAESVSMGLISDPVEYLQESSRLQMILDEMKWQPVERLEDIVSNYRDLLLSDNFSSLIRSKLEEMARKEISVRNAGNSTLELEAVHQKERETMTQLVNYAQLLLKEAQALGAELENNQLEVIRSICLVAMDPSHTTEEETSMALADAVRDMRPLLDENFVAYLKYAIGEEEANLARKGVLDDPEYNRWLFVLKIVQGGVYAELSKSIRRYIDHISYVLRMKTKADRRALLSKLIDVMPSLDVRPFVKCVDNIAVSLGSIVKGEFTEDQILGVMTNKILQLRRDVHDLLPPERIKSMSQDADEWAERQRQKLYERRNVSLQRLKAGKETEHYNDDSLFQAKGDVERMP